jgi:uncharacterized coiled-coil protein SlyX
MSHCISSRLALAALIAAAVIPLSTRAQSQDSQPQSVADAARRAREQKKAAAKQPAPVITDDTLKPSAPPAQAANAPAPAQSPEAAAAKPATASSSAPAEQPAPGSPAEDADQKAKASAELASLKEELTQAQKNLDLVQRELGLEQDNVYSKPNYASDTAGKTKLDDLKRQVTDKQQTVDALKTRLAALLDSLGSTAPAAPAAPPQI